MRRAGEHQEQVRRNIEFAGTPPAITGGSSEGSIFNKPWCYLAIAGLVFGFGGWMVSEVVLQVRMSMVLDMLQHSRTPSAEEMGALFILNCLWYMTVCVCVGFGLSSVEKFMDANYSGAAVRGLIAAGIGLLIGPVACIFTEIVYASLGGGQEDTLLAVQMFARAVGWAFIGCFVAIVPGILMKNGKKFGLGVAGGAIGGLLGGFLFDPITIVTQTDVLARIVGIVGFGTIAGLAMGLLEEAAKQGWLKVAAGLLAGKQFIIYKNPTIIGSSPKSEIYLFKDTAVMPSHAAIRIQGKSFVIEALDRNGIVYVNSQPVSQRRLLNGDFINIGSTQFLFGTKDIQTN